MCRKTRFKSSTISNCYKNLYVFLIKSTYVWLDQIHKLEPHWITPYILKSMMRTDRQQEWVPRKYKMSQDLENTLADRWTCFRIFFMHFNFYFGVQPPPPSQKKNTKKRDSSAVTPFFFMYLMYKNINPKKGNIDKDMNLVSFNPRNALNKKK